MEAKRLNWYGHMKRMGGKYMALKSLEMNFFPTQKNGKKKRESIKQWITGIARKTEIVRWKQGWEERCNPTRTIYTYK